MSENFAWTLLPKDRSSSIRNVANPRLHRSRREHMLEGKR